MSQLRLLWCHGSLGVPWATKSNALAQTAKELGLTMEAPDFRFTEDPDERVDHLLELLKMDDTPVVIAGSSMGGYVASVAARYADIRGLFLLAPAFYLPGYAVHVFSGLPEATSVVHGWQDEVVPVDNAIRFARTHKTRLSLVDDNHRLEHSTVYLQNQFALFLQDILSC